MELSVAELALVLLPVSLAAPVTGWVICRFGSMSVAECYRVSVAVMIAVFVIVWMMFIVPGVAR